MKKRPEPVHSYINDTDTELYYLQSRYYDPELGRFISADVYAATGQGLIGNNMFAYCGNNPVNRTDATGQDWWHWAVAAAIVVVAAVAVVATAGGVAGAAVAIASVANGVAVSSTATTVAAGVFIGSSYALAASTIGAIYESDSIEDFADYGEGALISTVAGGGVGGFSAYNLPGHNCFVAGTLIMTQYGAVPIEEIEEGNYVWAWDEESGRIELKEVVETYENQTTELVHVFVNGEEIITTPTHPFYSPVKGWTDAVKLRAGDILVLVNGEYVVVEKVQHEILEALVIVYNFQVKDYHTYFVSASGIVVHNSCNHNSAWDKERRQNWIDTAKTAAPGEDYGAYVATPENITRMSKGLAPIGWDGYSVQLHHWSGITNDFYDYSPLSRTLHLIIHAIK